MPCHTCYKPLHTKLCLIYFHRYPACRVTSNHTVWKEEMFALNWPALFLSALFLPIQVNGCRNLYIHRDIVGYRCQPHDDTTITQLGNMGWDQCMGYCLHNSNCTLVTYDAALMACILYANMCSNMTQTNSDVRTIILSPIPRKCLEWRQFDALWPENLVIVNEIGASGFNYAVARLTSGSRALPARYNPETSFITTDGAEEVTTGTAEYLTIDPHCPFKWVTWTNTSGNDLPAGAVMGGHLENGTPLYVAKAWLNLWGGIWMICYYNPETGQAPVHFEGRVYDTTNMDILVIL